MVSKNPTSDSASVRLTESVNPKKIVTNSVNPLKKSVNPGKSQQSTPVPKKK